MNFWLVGFLDMGEWAVFSGFLLHSHLKATDGFLITCLLLCLAAYLGDKEKGVTTLWSQIQWSPFQESSQEPTDPCGCSYLQRMAQCWQSHTVFHCRALLKDLHPGQVACMALHTFPCPRWHPLPQAACYVHHMWVMVQSMMLVHPYLGTAPRGWAGHLGSAALPLSMEALRTPSCPSRSASLDCGLSWLTGLSWAQTLYGGVWMP